MKSIVFHMQGYRDLPDDFPSRYESIWINLPNDELCKSENVAKYLRWNIEELELADDLGFDGVGVNEHHQNGYGFPVSPNLIASILARRQSDCGIVLLGTTLPMYNPPIRLAEEIAILDCLSGGRIVAGMPVGSPADTIGCYGIPPTEVRQRWYEAHDLITQAWTRPGPFSVQWPLHEITLRQSMAEAVAETHPAHLAHWRFVDGDVEIRHRSQLHLQLHHL
jgi:alkanesulfonate monooxygenase SsuD/methylene tetrahydromethanopterin reductase-like flavin-dependent oxidoreductase (luciferase family)